MDNHAIELIQSDLDTVEISSGSTPKIKPKAFHGILLDFVDITDSNSEASPVAVAANVIAFFCALIGRHAYQHIGDNQIHCRPFFLLVGKSSKARKGTAEGLPRRVFKCVDEILKQKNPDHLPLQIHGGGLSSGEGIAYAIRDASLEGKTVDSGVTDKRLLVIESEFANVLANCKRESSTLSAVLRNVFDGHNLSPLTKNNRTSATKPHVVVIGHITNHELIQKISSVEISNGLLNRFLICLIARERFVPLPSRTDENVIYQLATKIADIIEFIAIQARNNADGMEINLTDQATVYWKKCYLKLSADIPGNTGALLARAEVYTLMLAMIFALLDKKTSIDSDHIEAALCWIDFVGDSVRYLFQNGNEAHLEGIAQEILRQLQEQGQMTRTEINKAFNGHKSAEEIKQALEHLLYQTPPRIQQLKDENTGGRPRISYSVCGLS